MIRTKTFYLSLLSFFLYHLSFAKTPQSIKDTIRIDEIVITGSPVKVNRNNIPMAVSIVTRKQLEESDESSLLPILSGRIPGLFVTERGVTGFGVATGGAGQITIRGIGGSPTTGVLMLIDGHPQFMGIMGHPLPDSYVASDVEKVEVIRGPASILYGSNAMGGVVNIITKKQSKDGFNGNARLLYGSYNTQKYMLSEGYKKDKFSVFASVNHDQTNGHRDHSDFNITNGYLKLGYELNENLKASLDFSLANFDASDPGPDTINAIFGETIDITRGYSAFALDNSFDNYSGSLKVFYNFGEHDITDGFHSTDHNYGINLFEAFKFFKGNNLTFGFDYMNYGGMAENLLAMNGAGMVFTDTTVQELGVYGFMQQDLYDKLTLNAGLRYQDHNVYGGEWIPSAGFTYKLAGQTAWKGTVSKGFRSPTIRELFLWNHNSNLKPERIMNYETGIIQSLFEHRLKLELTAFMVEGDNLIVTVPMVGLLNSGEISNKGIEFAADARATEKLNLHLAYSYTNMKTPVYATPEHQLFISGRYQVNKLSLTASLQQVINLDTDASTLVSKETYTLLNAKASYKLFKYADIFVSGENLLDQVYETNRYYTMPGTTVFSGINLHF